MPNPWRLELGPRNPMYDIEILHSVTDIRKEAWNVLAPLDDPLWQWSYFKVMESSGIGPDGFEYIVFRRDSRIVAILPTFWFHAYPLSLGLGGKLDKAVAKFCALVPALLQLRVYFCGHPMAEGRLLTAGNESFSIDRRVFEAVRERAWAKGLHWIIFKDFSEPAIPTLFSALKSSKFFAVQGLPDARLRLLWPSFEDYVRDGKSNAKRNIRNRLRKFAKSTNLRIEIMDTSEDIFLDIMPLYYHVLARAKLELERLTPAYFTSLSADRDIDKKFVVCFDGDQLIGYVLCLFAGKGGVCLRGGFDYQMSRDSGCYFVLQYESIKIAISAGCREMSFCQTTYLPKLALGCHLAPHQHVATHRSGFWRPIIRLLLPMLFSRYATICGLDRAGLAAPRDLMAARGVIPS